MSVIPDGGHPPTSIPAGAPRFRVLHCIPSMTGGGAERQLALLSAAQVRRGHEVHVALVRRGANFQRLVSSGAIIHQLGAVAEDVRDGLVEGQLSARQRLDVATDVVRLISRLQPHVTQTWLPSMDVVGGSAATLAGVPWVLSERESASSYPPGAATRGREIVARTAAAVVANSAAGAVYWSSRLSGRTVEVIPNAAPIDEIDASPPATAWPRGSLVLFVGRLCAQKDPLMFVESVRLAAREVPVHAVLCGVGPMHGEIQQAVSEAGLQGGVTIAGYRSDVWSLMKSAGAMVSTSLFEGRPNGVIEAMAARCPVVLSDIPEHREVADETVASFARTHAPADFAAALVDTVRGGTLVEERIARARAAAERWSVDGLVARYDQVYERIALAGSRARALLQLVRPSGHGPAST